MDPALIYPPTMDSSAAAPDPRPQPPVGGHQLDRMVRDAWARVREESPPLDTYYSNREQHQFERALVFRLGVQLDRIIREVAASWPDGWSEVTVDSELQLAGDGAFKFPGGPKYPDLIVHVRGNDRFNLLVLEGKHDSRPDGPDMNKLRYLKNGSHFYRNAWALNLQRNGDLEIVKV